jgi:hypothetical protein
MNTVKIFVIDPIALIESFLYAYSCHFLHFAFLTTMAMQISLIQL